MVMIITYLKDIRLHIAIGFLFGIIASIFFSYVPIYYSYVIERLIRNSSADIHKILASYVVYKSLGTAFASIRGGFFIHSIGKITKRVKRDVLDIFKTLEISYFELNNKNQVINILHEDCEKSAHVVTTNINIVIRTITQFFISSYILWRTSRHLYAMLIILAMIDAFLNNVYYNQVYDKYIHRLNKIKNLQNDIISEYVSKADIYRVNNIDVFSRWMDHQEEFDKNKSVESFHYMINSFLFNIFHSFIVVSLIYVGLKIEVDLLVIHRFLLYLDEFILLLKNFRHVYDEMYRNIDNIYRVSNMLTTKRSADGAYIPTNSDWCPDIDIDIEHFCYPDKDIRLLENLRMHIGYGMRIGLHGISGCGKSTLIRLIMRLYRLDHGKIMLDGVHINHFNGEWLYENIFAYVNQEPILFEGSIEENISMFGHNDAIDKHILSLIGDIKGDGIRVSGGQKQRIAICRALFKKSKILILDEPTSALDVDNERSFLEIIDYIHKQRNITIITVSHKKEILDACDKIFHIGKA